MAKAENYLLVGPFTLWWSAGQPERIHLTHSDDERFVDEDGQRPGLRVVFSANPRSADYNPANFNRCARALAAAGKPAPAEVPLQSRKLADRNAVMAALGDGTAEPSSSIGLEQSGWSECPECRAIVTDTVAHAAAAHGS